MSRVGTQICGVCQCQFGDSDCVHFTGQGTVDDPYVPEIVIDPDADNMVECGPGGLAAFLEPLYLDPPACNIYATIDQQVPYDTVWPLLFNEERYDTDSMHMGSEGEAESSRITFNTPGLYLVTLDVRWKKTNDSTATGDMAIFIRKNASDFLGLDSYPVPNGDWYAKQSLTIEYPFEAGDYVDALAKHDVELDDEPMNLTITSERMSPNFSAVFLRPIRSMNILGVPESNPSEGGGGVGTETLLSGTQWWETPDHASLDIAGDIDIRIAAAAVDWTPGSSALALISKMGDSAGERSYRLTIEVGGVSPFRLSTSADGTAALSSDSTAATGAVDGTVLAIRATRDVDNGSVQHETTFYTKSTTPATALTDISSDAGWTLLGAAVTVAGVTSIFNSAVPLTVGVQGADDAPTNFFTGNVYAAVVKDGINGTTVANPNFYANNSPFTDSSGRTWTKNG